MNIYILVIAMFTCDHQVKKILELVKQNIISRFYTRVNIITYSNTAGCLPSSTDSHAVARTSEVKDGLHQTRTNNK